MSSTYQADFGYQESNVRPQKNIFYYKKINCMDFSDFLAPIAVQFLDSWLELKDHPDWQTLVLETLRSLNSRYKTFLKSESEYK